MLGSVPTHGDIRRLIGLKPILVASDNISLVRRPSSIIAVELENKKGYIELDGQYRDAISNTVMSGKITVAPYSVLVLERCANKE